MNTQRRFLCSAIGFAAIAALSDSVLAQGGGAQPACTIESCALWSDGFTLLRGIPGRPLGWESLDSAVAARSALGPLARKYYDARASEEAVSGAIWGVGTFVPLGWTALWMVKSLSALGGGGRVEDATSKLRREFLVAAAGTADPAGSVSREPRYVLSKSMVIDARTGTSAAHMRPLWNSLDPIKPLLGDNPDALRWFADAESAQRRHRTATAILPAAWLTMFLGFGMAFSGSDSGVVGLMFFGGAAATAASIGVRVASDRATRRNIGRALYLATPP